MGISINKLNFIFRIQGFFWSRDRAIYFEELVMLFVPITMILFGGQYEITQDYLYEVFFKWVHIMICCNVLYVAFFINRGHHTPNSIHQGDEIQSFDFGEYQISTICDRLAVNENLFLILVYQGEHILHQLFPSIDASLLPQLKSTLIDTCKEFDIKLKTCTIVEGFIGQWKQLYRTELNIYNCK